MARPMSVCTCGSRGVPLRLDRRYRGSQEQSEPIDRSAKDRVPAVQGGDQVGKAHKLHCGSRERHGEAGSEDDYARRTYDPVCDDLQQ